jgi:hypothetical protein
MEGQEGKQSIGRGLIRNLYLNVTVQDSLLVQVFQRQERVHQPIQNKVLREAADACKVLSAKSLFYTATRRLLQLSY